MSTPVVRRLLVPIDFSEGSVRALAWARALARACDAQIVLLHVVDLGATWVPLSGPAVYPAPVPPSIAAQVADVARAALEGLEQEAPEVSQRIVRTGHPRDVIPEVAREIAADLIVMGSHSRRGVSRLLIGSVAEHVVRHAPVPVLVVRGEGLEA